MSDPKVFGQEWGGVPWFYIPGAARAGAANNRVVLAHMNHPQSGTAAGVSDAISALRAAGWEFASLAGQVVN